MEEVITGEQEQEVPPISAEEAPSTEETGAQEASSPEQKEEEGLKAALLAERKQRQAAQQQAARLEGMVEALKKPEQAEPTPASPKPQRPNAAHFADQEEYDSAYALYEEAIVDWKIEQRDTARQAEQAKQQEQERQQRITAGIHGLTKKGSEKHSDFMETAFLPRGLEGFFIESERGADIAYYLGKNPEIVDGFQGKPKEQVVFELGRIDAKLSLASQKQTTTAPEPITPVSSQKSSGKLEYKEDMSDADFEKWYRERRNRR